MTTAASTDMRPPTIRPDRRTHAVALALLALAQLMLVLDVTVVNVALPDIGTSLGLHRQLPWVTTSYTLFFGGLMLLGGRLADLHGPRRLTLIGLALFTTASLLCGLSGGAMVLLVGRSLQGVGVALLSPAALATRPRRADHRVRTSRIEVQLRASDRILEPHRPWPLSRSP